MVTLNCPVPFQFNVNFIRWERYPSNPTASVETITAGTGTR